MSTFKITEPGFYVNRFGEKIEIEARDEEDNLDYATYPWRATSKHTPQDTYSRDGKVGLYWDEDSRDIVDVWEEPGVQHSKTPSYNLELISERFRALEEGRSLSFPAGNGFDFDVIATLDNITVHTYRLLNKNTPWSLIPLTRTITTKLWVYKITCNYADSSKVETLIFRGERPSPGGECLGAIEGSEQTEEVEV